MTFDIVGRYRKLMMGVSALWVIMFHYWLPVVSGKLSFVENMVKGAGFCGVDIFFLLSGFGLFYSMEKSDRALPFYGKRLAKLWFPVTAMAVFRMFYESWGFAGFIGRLSGYMFVTESIYSYLWFVYMLIILYLLFPLYYRLFRASESKTLFTFTVFCIWLIISLFLRDRLRWDLWGATNRIPVFLLGVLYGYLAKSGRRISKTGVAALVTTLILGGYLCYLTNFRQFFLVVPTSNCCFPNLLISASLPILIGIVLDRIKPGVRKIIVGIFEAAGAVSLELYCVQEVSADLTAKLLPEALNGVHNIAVYVVCIVFAAVLSYIQKAGGAVTGLIPSKEKK